MSINNPVLDSPNACVAGFRTDAGDLLERMRAQGLLHVLDLQLVDWARRRGNDGNRLPDELRLALALASRAIRESHTCLDLSAVTAAWINGGASSPMEETAVWEAWSETWHNADRRSALHARYPRILGDAHASEAPFVLDGNRLYLRRFYSYERAVASRLRAMAESDAAELDSDIRADIETLFDLPEAREAAQKALTRRLCVISGGPGTGKTHTAARILALLARQRRCGIRLRVQTAAPTGKAAVRVEESLAAARRHLPEAFQAPFEPACTIERLLGYRRFSPYFRHSAEHPLPADVVLVDEASMIDLPKMAKLLDALREDARLILLGDRHQLASVQPGSVMGDICAWPALRDSVVELKTSHRFQAGTPVARLSAAVNEAGTDASAASAWDTLTELSATPGESTENRVRHRPLPRTLTHASGRIDAAFAQAILAGFGGYMNADDPEGAFEELARFRVLCALRHGPFGVHAVNRLIENVLAGNGVDRTAEGDAFPRHRLHPCAEGFYHRRVLLITRNDYSLGLFNGDIGIVWPDTNDGGALKVFFEKTTPAQDGERFRKLSGRLLPHHETAFAMTVHKSQGSEFDRVLLMLPKVDSLVVTRELIYTGITRVREEVEIWADPAGFTEAVRRRVNRFSGLSMICGQMTR